MIKITIRHFQLHYGLNGDVTEGYLLTANLLCEQRDESSEESAEDESLLSGSVDYSMEFSGLLYGVQC